MRHGTRLGIDPGDARIGVARSDPSGVLATPVETVRREDPKVGRNDDCPCGSGKKFKKCCLGVLGSAA